MTTYQSLGPAQGGPNTAGPDQTGLNTGNLTNQLTGSFIGKNPPQFELYHATVTNVPTGAQAQIYVNRQLYSFTFPFSGSEWDPSQPLFLRPGDEIDFFWNVAAQPIILSQNYDFETGVSPWTGNAHTSALTTSTLFAFSGTHSLNFTGDGAGSPAIISGTTPVNSAQTYTISAEFLAPAGWAAGVQAVLNWYTAGLGFISSAGGSVVALPAGTAFTQVSVTGVAPPTAAIVVMNFDIQGIPGAGVQFYADWAQVVAGSAPAPAPAQSLPIVTTFFRFDIDLPINKSYATTGL